MDSTFAQRLFWARHRKGLGASRLSRLVGCAQSLISNIENREGTSGSPEYNDKFAKALDVSPHWLAHGTAPHPKGFDEEALKRVRAARSGKERMPLGNVVTLDRTFSSDPNPGWAAPEPTAKQSISSIAALQKSLLADFMDYARIAGPENARNFLDLMKHSVQFVTSTNANLDRRK